MFHFSFLNIFKEKSSFFIIDITKEKEEEEHFKEIEIALFSIFIYRYLSCVLKSFCCLLSTSI